MEFINCCASSAYPVNRLVSIELYHNDITFFLDLEKVTGINVDGGFFDLYFSVFNGFDDFRREVEKLNSFYVVVRFASDDGVELGVDFYCCHSSTGLCFGGDLVSHLRFTVSRMLWNMPPKHDLDTVKYFRV